MYLQFKSLTLIKNFMTSHKLFDQFYVLYHYNDMFDVYYCHVEFFKNFNVINKYDKNIYFSTLLL